MIGTSKAVSHIGPSPSHPSADGFSDVDGGKSTMMMMLLLLLLLLYGEDKTAERHDRKL